MLDSALAFARARRGTRCRHRTDHRLSGRAGRLFRSRLPAGVPGDDDACPAPPSRTPSRRCATARRVLAMIPIENSVAGRVADIHHLMPDSGLYIIGEHFERVNHHLLALPGATLDTIRAVRSHVHALSQCRNFLRARAEPVVRADTAGSAAEIKELGDPSVAAIASELAGEIYGLVSLAREHRGRRAQHDPLPDHVARAEPAAARRPDRHDLRLQRAQRAGGALQGAGRLRHQRRQHDQAGKLHGRRPVHRDAVLRRCRGAPRRPPARSWRSRSSTSSRPRSRSSASTRPTRCASPRASRKTGED